jgi:hypothetical protein
MPEQEAGDRLHVVVHVYDDLSVGQSGTLVAGSALGKLR